MSKTILVIDDEELIRNGLADALKSAGFSVETASNGKEGLKKAIARQVDLVVTDIRMPEMDGLKMVEELRKDDKGKKLPVIILSVDEQTESINQALKAGVTVYLAKDSLEPTAMARQIVDSLK